MVRKHLTLAGLLLAGLIASERGAYAARLEVSPTMVELSATARSGLLTLTNRGEESVSIQVRSFKWAQTTTDDPLTPTRTLLVSPPIFDLKPGESQTVRILLREAPDTIETSYRLLVDELPTLDTPTAVRLPLRLSLPVFAEPAGHVYPDLRWSLVQAGSDDTEIEAVNHGTRRERAFDVALAVPGRPAIRPSSLSNAWVLPGATRHWRITAPLSLPDASAAKVTARSDSGPINASAPLKRAP